MNGSTTTTFLAGQRIRNPVPTRYLPGDLAPDADTRFVSGDVRPIHQEMAFAAGDKNIWIVSSGDLAGQFYECGLLNEIVVRIASVTIFGQDFVELYYQVPAR